MLCWRYYAAGATMPRCIYRKQARGEQRRSMPLSVSDDRAALTHSNVNARVIVFVRPITC